MSSRACRIIERRGIEMIIAMISNPGNSMR